MGHRTFDVSYPFGRSGKRTIPVDVFAGHTIGASSVAFSHRGAMLATGDLKGSIRLFVAAIAADVAQDLARDEAARVIPFAVPAPAIPNR